MTIFNQTPNTIKITGRDVETTEIKPGETFDVFSRMFDIISLHSEEGSCIITVAYGERNFETFGNITIEEQGKKNVVISCN